MSRNTLLKFLNTPEVTPCTPSPSFPTREMSVLIIQVIMLSSIRMYLNESDTRNQHYAKNSIVLFLCCRVLKFEIKGFLGVLRKKKQHPRGLFAKNQQIGFEILARLCSDDSKQIHLNLTQFITSRRICMESSEQNGTRRQFAPQCQFLASRPFRYCSFKISQQIP